MRCDTFVVCYDHNYLKEKDISLPLVHILLDIELGCLETFFD